jgi:uncharacterized protein YqjF (DUF2071 family)
MLFQDWSDVVFVHWPCEPQALAALVPGGLRLESFDGAAWLSLISFRIPRMRPMGMPPLPGLASGTETHIRTYVETADGRRGIWLLSVEFEPALGAAIARGAFWLPYWWSPHRVQTDGGRARYLARRRWPAGTAVEVSVEPGAAIRTSRRDHFLTARWILFLRYGPVLMASPVEHPRWPLRSARLLTLDESVTRRSGLPPPPRDPLVHYSPGVSARIGFPRVVPSRGATV